MISHEQIVTTEEVPLARTYEDIPVFADSQDAAWDSDNEAELATKRGRKTNDYNY